MPLHKAYSPLLVILSVLIASAASYTALDLAGRVTASRGRERLAWLAGGSLAMGVGIWSMHFVGMLAFHLPEPIGGGPVRARRGRLVHGAGHRGDALHRDGRSECARDDGVRFRPGGGLGG